MTKKRIRNGRLPLGMLLCLMALWICCTPIRAGETSGTVYRVAVNAEHPPFQFLNEENTVTGLHVELLDAVGENRNISFQYICYEKGYECLQALNAGEVDIVLGYPIGSTETYSFLSVGEISSSYLCTMASKNTAEEMADQQKFTSYRAGMEYGSINHSYLLMQLGIGNYIAAGDQNAVYQMLVDQKADIVVGERECLLYLLNQNGQEKNYTILQDYVSPVSYTMYVSASNIKLHNTLVEGISQLRANGQYEKIHDAWLIDRDLLSVQSDFDRATRLFLAAACIAAVVILFIALLNRILTRSVQEKTLQLSDANGELLEQMRHLQNANAIRDCVLDLSYWGILLYDGHDQVLLANHAASQIALTKESLVGKNVRELPVFCELLGRLEAAPADGVPGGPYSVIALGEGVNERQYRCGTVSAMQSEGLKNTLLTVEDMTMEARKKQALFEREKNLALNRIVAGVAHEIRNPLMSIKTAIFLLKNRGNSEEVQNTIVRCLPDEVDRINRLVEGLIDYARPIRTESELLDLSEVVRDCVYIAAPSIKKGELSLEMSMTPGLHVCINRDRLKQAVINLILNGTEAIQQKQENGAPLLRMTISTFAGGENLACLRVRDEGIGMSEAEIARCTSPFYTTKATGTGLGLALVQELISESDGKMEITSVPSAYTEITLYLRSTENET